MASSMLHQADGKGAVSAPSTADSKRGGAQLFFFVPLVKSSGSDLSELPNAGIAAQKQRFKRKSLDNGSRSTKGRRVGAAAVARRASGPGGRASPSLGSSRPGRSSRASCGGGSSSSGRLSRQSLPKTHSSSRESMVFDHHEERGHRHHDHHASPLLPTIRSLSEMQVCLGQLGFLSEVTVAATAGDDDENDDAIDRADPTPHHDVIALLADDDDDDRAESIASSMGVMATSFRMGVKGSGSFSVLVDDSRRQVSSITQPQDPDKLSLHYLQDDDDDDADDSAAAVITRIHLVQFAPCLVAGVVASSTVAAGQINNTKTPSAFQQPPPQNPWLTRNHRRAVQSAIRREAKERAARVRLLLVELSRECFSQRQRMEMDALRTLKTLFVESRRSAALERASPKKASQRAIDGESSCSPDVCEKEDANVYISPSAASANDSVPYCDDRRQPRRPADQGRSSSQRSTVTPLSVASLVSSPQLSSAAGSGVAAPVAVIPSDILALHADLLSLNAVLDLRPKALHHVGALLNADKGETTVRDAALRRNARERNELQETLQLLGNYLIKGSERELAADEATAARGGVANDASSAAACANFKESCCLTTHALKALQFCVLAKRHHTGSAAASGRSSTNGGKFTASSMEGTSSLLEGRVSARTFLAAFHLDLIRVMKSFIAESHNTAPEGLEPLHLAAEAVVTSVAALTDAVANATSVATPAAASSATAHAAAVGGGGGVLSVPCVSQLWVAVDKTACHVATTWEAFDAEMRRSQRAATRDMLRGLTAAYRSMKRGLLTAMANPQQQQQSPPPTHHAHRHSSDVTTPPPSSRHQTNPASSPASAAASPPSLSPPDSEKSRRLAAANAYRAMRRRETTAAIQAEMQRLLKMIRGIGGQAAVDAATRDDDRQA